MGRQITPSNAGDIESAEECVLTNDLVSARTILKAPGSLSDDTLRRAVLAHKKGRELFLSGRHPEAVEPLREAWVVLEKCYCPKTHLILPIICRAAEGIRALQDGDAHKALELFNVGSDALDELCQYAPGYRVESLSYKSMALIALARTHLNAARMEQAEKALGELRAVQDELLAELDPSEPNHTKGLIEVHGTRLELAVAFIGYADTPALDLEKWGRRLDDTRNDVCILSEQLRVSPKNSITYVCSAYLPLHSALRILLATLEAVLDQRRPLDRQEQEDLARAGELLHRAIQDARKGGERGQGMLYALGVFQRLQQNLLRIGAVDRSDFGKFSGLVAVAVFAVLLSLLYLTGYSEWQYFASVVFLSLVAGFGTGAVRFWSAFKGVFTGRDTPSA